MSFSDAALPWIGEPDKRKWIDAETGYTCLALRGPTGAWCGYVSAPEGHPAHGRSYYTDSFSVEDLLSGNKTLADATIQRAINEISVHGGLTYAGSNITEGDTYWFGFDCAHAGDFSPKYDKPNDPVLGLGCPTGWGGAITYRTLEYVEENCARLAAQLWALRGGAQVASTTEADEVPGTPQDTDLADLSKADRAEGRS